ncbi:TetR/AcrR family transcriptional regulator [uncultured Devosia sp.]|uniref:TetR/AcrR family transcriptional regulator n=1 Tax=uncultured Devosia sp. TaxID=211434 RepID=UPI002636675D|nr:TetR/AcrR family transcriptional regulator [uncultured Devosia sp.]
MARAYLSADERREQILDCAQNLFFSKGFEATTVQDLMAAAGVSKGGFYHHFGAKEDVLEALSQRLARTSVALIESVRDTPGLCGFERLEKTMRALGQFKKENAKGLVAAFSAVLLPENAVLYDRINRANMSAILPLFAEIIEEGRQDGSFNVPDARLAAQALLSLGGMSREAVGAAVKARGRADRAAANAELERALAWQGVVVDRILGLPDGSITLVEAGFVDAILPVDD